MLPTIEGVCYECQILHVTFEISETSRAALPQGRLGRRQPAALSPPFSSSASPPREWLLAKPRDRKDDGSWATRRLLVGCELGWPGESPRATAAAVMDLAMATAKTVTAVTASAGSGGGDGAREGSTARSTRKPSRPAAPMAVSSMAFFADLYDGDGGGISDLNRFVGYETSTAATVEDDDDDAFDLVNHTARSLASYSGHTIASSSGLPRATDEEDDGLPLSPIFFLRSRRHRGQCWCPLPSPSCGGCAVAGGGVATCPRT